MTGMKRSCTCNEGEGQKQKSKKQKTVPATARASVIDEAFKVDSQQNVLLMEFVRRFVREAVEQVERKFKRQVEKKVKRVKQDVKRALAYSGIVIYGERSPPKQIEGPDGRNLQLRFLSRLSLPLFTEVKVKGEQDAAIYVVLIDKNTGNPVTSGPESSAKLEVVVLEGDFNNEDDDDWTREDFESQVVKVREGKRPILIGDLKVSLKEGVGSLGEFTFTDNSCWTRSKKFRLGAKVASDFCEGFRIREAKTDAFKVKDHRGKSYEKHYPPKLVDEVWRLETIHKNGAFHERLNKAKVHNVQDFLRLLVTDSGRLREILQKRMSDMKWNILEKHARTCVLSKTQYVYYADDTKTTGVIFNIIYELTGLIADGKYYSAETLSDNQKVFVDSLMKQTNDNWTNVTEYYGSMLNEKQSERASSSRVEVASGASADHSVYFNQQESLPRLSSSVPSEQAVGSYPVYPDPAIFPSPLPSPDPVELCWPDPDPVLDVGGGMGCDENIANRNPSPSQLSNAQMPLESNSFGQPNWLESASCFELQSTGPSGLPSNIGSPLLPENDPVYQLLSCFFSSGAAPENVSNDGYPLCMPISNDVYSLNMPTPSTNLGFEEDRRSSGKAVVGWLKLKVSLRWGIFIRKKAAEKRAQLIELED